MHTKPRRLLLFSALSILPLFASAAGEPATDRLLDHATINRFSPLTAPQLIDTATWYYNRNHLDTAFLCFSLVINAPEKDSDRAAQEHVIDALNKLGVIYCRMCDYRHAYELFIRALELCDKYRYEQYRLRVYNNLGNIYYFFKKYDVAKQYYTQALQLYEDSTGVAVMLNNIGTVEMENGHLDSAFYYLRRSLAVSERHGNAYRHTILNTTASFYQQRRQYDSAFRYFRLSLAEARKNNNAEYEALNLSGLGKLFFERHRPDSARRYLRLSNAIVEHHHFFNIYSENYLALSKIEASQGHYQQALQYFQTHAGIRDSVFDVKVFSDINQLQRLYEVSKTNRQIERLTVEQQIKARTIYYQTIIQAITFAMLLLVSAGLLFLFLQKRKLNTAYKALFEKNREIIALQPAAPLSHQRPLPNDVQNELFGKILTVLDDTALICDPAFSVNKLAVLVQSNYNYVSQVINGTFGKNFRALLNSYRIREAQRLLSAPGAEKYTLESVAHQVGFKSRSAFRDAFKEITGIGPAFYLKKIQEGMHC